MNLNRLITTLAIGLMLYKGTPLFALDNEQSFQSYENIQSSSSTEDIWNPQGSVTNPTNSATQNSTEDIWNPQGSVTNPSNPATQNSTEDIWNPQGSDSSPTNSATQNSTEDIWNPQGSVSSPTNSATQNSSDGFWNTQKETSNEPQYEGFIQSYDEPPPIAGGPIIDENELLPAFVPSKKEMASPSQFIEKPFVSAEDVLELFPFLRGPGGSYQGILKPGVTMDGIQFESYNDSRKFIENHYRQTNFSIKNIYRDIRFKDQNTRCLYCHQGIEEIDKNHRWSCRKCHAGNYRKKNIDEAHDGLVANPSAPEHVEKYCGKCHADQIEKMQLSAKSTSSAIADSVRYAWTIPKRQETETIQVEPWNHINTLSQESSMENQIETEPEPGTGPVQAHESENALNQAAPEAERFIQSQCSQCHLDKKGWNRPGDYRAKGCAGCHMVYSSDGRSMSHDLAIQHVQRKEIKNRRDRFLKKYADRSESNPRGFPLLHKFTRAVPSLQCETCHSQNGVGSEYEGRFARSGLESSKNVEGEKPVLHGREHQFLLPDIHKERGMHCIDCHTGEEIKSAPTMENKIKCEDCHGTHLDPPESYLLTSNDPKSKAILEKISKTPNLAQKIKKDDTLLAAPSGRVLSHIRKEKKGWALYSKVTGRRHMIPLLKDSEIPAGHRPTEHMEKVECHACHARWSAGEWGLLVSKTQGNGGENSSIKGAKAFTETGWDTMILGKNERDKYSVMKPQYQYYISNQELDDSGVRPSQTADGKPGLLMRPYAPHTIRKNARPCESCHQNPMAVGLGDPAMKNAVDGIFSNQAAEQEIPIKQMITPEGQALQTPYPPGGARFLNSEEAMSLLGVSDAYRALRFLSLKESQFPRLLQRNEFPYDRRRKSRERQLERELDLLKSEQINEMQYTGEGGFQ